MRRRSSEIAGNDKNLFPRVIYMKICSSVGARFASLTRDGGDFGWGLSTGACEINGPDEKNFLAMAINSNMNAGGASRGSISRNYESCRDASAYAHFERLFRSALRGHGLSFRRDSGECSVYSR